MLFFLGPKPIRFVWLTKFAQSYFSGNFQACLQVILSLHPCIIGGTIHEKIRYGRLEAGGDGIVAAARPANAHEFILDFPRGYDALVGERGMNLRGGQRQRIAVLERGCIIELGSRDELMAKNGLYTRLYTMQFRNPEEELALMLESSLLEYVLLHNEQDLALGALIIASTRTIRIRKAVS